MRYRFITQIKGRTHMSYHHFQAMDMSQVEQDLVQEEQNHQMLQTKHSFLSLAMSTLLFWLPLWHFQFFAH